MKQIVENNRSCCHEICGFLAASIAFSIKIFICQELDTIQCIVFVSPFNFIIPFHFMFLLLPLSFLNHSASIISSCWLFFVFEISIIISNGVFAQYRLLLKQLMATTIDFVPDGAFKLIECVNMVENLFMYIYNI